MSEIPKGEGSVVSPSAATDAAALAELAAKDSATKAAATSDASVKAVDASRVAADAASIVQGAVTSSNLPSQATVDAAVKQSVDSTVNANVVAVEAATKASVAREQADVAAVLVAKAAVETEALAGTPPKEPQTLIAASITTGYYDLLKTVVLDRQLSSSDKGVLLSHLKAVSPVSDRLTYRTAIYLIGTIAVLTIIAIWNLLWIGKAIPDGLIAIASGAVGGLAGLLSPSRNQDSQSSP